MPPEPGHHRLRSASFDIVPRGHAGDPLLSSCDLTSINPDLKTANPRASSPATTFDRRRGKARSC